MTGHAVTACEANPTLLLLSKVVSIPLSLGYPRKQQQEIHAGNGESLEVASDGQEVQNKLHHLQNHSRVKMGWTCCRTCAQASLHVSECNLLMPHPSLLLWKRVSIPNITAGSEARGLHQPRDLAACLLLPHPHHTCSGTACCIYPAVPGRQSGGRLRGFEGAELWGQLLDMVVPRFASMAEGRQRPLLLSGWSWGALISSPSWTYNQTTHRRYQH